MTGNDPRPIDTEPARAAAATRPRALRGALALLLVGGTAALAAAGVPLLSGPLPAAALVLLAGAAGWWLRPAASPGAGRAATPAGVTIEASPASDLARQVVPVWQRNVEAARQHSEQEAGALLESFARVSSHLDLALAATTEAPLLEVGALDELVERHRAEIDLLQTDAAHAIGLTRHVLDQLGEVSAHVDRMVALAGQVQGIAKATHMLALNASVEATRAGAAGAGFAVVARDVGELSGQSRQAAIEIAQLVNQVRDRIGTLRATRLQVDLDDEDLALRCEAHARGALRALMGSLGDSARSSRTLRDAGRQAQADIDTILMSLQAQDRLSQMLQSVTADMDRLERWLKGEPDEAARSASDWLSRLEASYTMEDLRSAHHATARIEKQAEVEFF